MSKTIVPKNSHIVIVAGEKNESFAESPDLDGDEKKLYQRNNEGLGYFSDIYCKIDGKEIEHIYYYLVRTKLFELNIPENPIYPMSTGKTTGLASGFVIVTLPLEANTTPKFEFGFQFDPRKESKIYTQLKGDLEIQNAKDTPVYEDLLAKHRYYMHTEFNITVD